MIIDLAMIDWNDMGYATLETLMMTGISLIFTILLGLPLGILLFITGKNQLFEQVKIYGVLSFCINFLRSIPFLILLIILLPFTLWLTGTSLGIQGAIPPLVIGTAPFFARLVENVLREIDHGIIEACQAMGARVDQIIIALLSEALPGLIAATTVTTITLMSYAAMSGVIGGGGLGDLAIRYGYQRFQIEVMIITIAILVVLVQLFQYVGDRFVQYFSHK